MTGSSPFFHSQTSPEIIRRVAKLRVCKVCNASEVRNSDLLCETGEYRIGWSRSSRPDMSAIGKVCSIAA